MRTLLALASLSFLITAGVGCGDDTSSGTSGDMAAKADMAAPGGDMAKTATCAAILSCIGACGNNGACQTGCYTNASTTAQNGFNPLLACMVSNCGPGDGGSGACTSPTDTSGACQLCLGMVFSGAMTAGMPCHAEFTNCATH
jgi:hypothetical protein